MRHFYLKPKLNKIFLMHSVNRICWCRRRSPPRCCCCCRVTDLVNVGKAREDKLNDIKNDNHLFIPVTRRVKGYTRFVGKYVTDRRKRFRPHKVYIFLIRITSRVDLAMSVCPSVCPSGWTLRSQKL